MSHSSPLITTIALALGFGLIFGFIAERVKLPALLGYLIAGLFIGPQNPWFAADMKLAGELAEIGVMLLMFGVGLHFSFDDLLKVRKIALPGAVVQITIASVLGGSLALLWGWGGKAALIFGISLSVASTVVVLRSLEARRLLDSINGRITVGWLVVQDMVMVLVLVLLPAFVARSGGEGGSIWGGLALTLGKVTIFIAFMLIVGRRVVPKLLWLVARTQSRELFTLCVISFAVSIAFAAAMLFGVSFALGAFFSGVIMRESDFGLRAAEESLPFRDAFSVLFFVSIGMLFDPMILIAHPIKILMMVILITLINPMAAAFVVVLFRYPFNTALLVMASLAQIGEFSIILIEFGVRLGALSREVESLILAAAIISITVNPIFFSITPRLHEWLRNKSRFIRKLENTSDPLSELPMATHEKFLSGQVVLVGYGLLGQRIAETLTNKGIPFVIAEQNREIVERLRARGLVVVWGDAAEPSVLIQAHIARASMLVIASSDIIDIRLMSDTAKTLNPGIEIVIRGKSEEEAELLTEEKIGKVFIAKQELAKTMSYYVLRRFGKTAKRAGH